MPALKPHQPQRLIFENFMKGLITRTTPERIPREAFSDAKNISLNEKIMPIKSLGQAKYNAAGLASYPVRGECIYETTSGTKYYVAACGGYIWYGLAGSGTFSKYQVALTAGGYGDMTINETAQVEFAQYNNKLYIVNGKYPVISNNDALYLTSRMIKIDGTAVTGLTVSDIPAGLQYIWQDKERLFGGNSISQPNGLFWTNAYFDYSTNNETNWTPVSGLNYAYVGKDDGENIAGIFPYQQSMYVFKQTSVYRYATMGDITNWGSVKLDTSYGCSFNRTIIEVEGYLYWLSPQGVVTSDGVNVQIVDDAIRDKILALPQLSSNSRQWQISQTSDWNTGTFSSDVLDTSDNELKQKIIAAGTLTINHFSNHLTPDSTYQYFSSGVWRTQLIFSTPKWIYGFQSLYGVYGGSGNVLVEGYSGSTLETLGTVVGMATQLSINPTKAYTMIQFTTSAIPPIPILSCFAAYGLATSATSNAIDFGFTPATYGNLLTVFNGSSGGVVSLTTQSSSDGTNWDSAVALSGTAVQSTLKRYLRIVSTITGGDGTQVPTFYLGGIWRSAVVDLSAAPAAWGNFDTVYNSAGQTVTYWIRSATSSGGVSSASFVQQLPGLQIALSALQRYIQVEVRINTLSATALPVVESLRVTYYTSSILAAPCAYGYNKEYCLCVTQPGSTVNDTMWKYQTENKYWLKRTNKYCNCFMIDEKIIISGTSQSDGFLRLNEIGNTDDGTAIDSYFVTANVEQGLFNNIFRMYFVSYLADNGWTFSYSLDNGATWTAMTIPATGSTQTLRKTLAGLVLGHFIMFKAEQSSTDASWQINEFGVEFDEGLAIRND